MCSGLKLVVSGHGEGEGATERDACGADGDGAGFDILSKQLNGKDKYIEVKTTKLGKETPFYFSSNELNFSQEHSDNFHLYRLFNFEDDAKMFIRNGGLDAICHVTPINFRGVVKG